MTKKGRAVKPGDFDSLVLPLGGGATVWNGSKAPSVAAPTEILNAPFGRSVAQPACGARRARGEQATLWIVYAAMGRSGLMPERSDGMQAVWARAVAVVVNGGRSGGDDR